MSYCRFSSMNWRSDVYVYEDVRGGWTTHVAARRRLLPPVPDMMSGPLAMRMHLWSGATWDPVSGALVYRSAVRARIYNWWCRFAAFWHNRVHMASLELIPMRPIGLAHDGEQFSDDVPEECAERLELLRSVGYRVPQQAIDALKAEAAGHAD